ncbi:MAG: F0F1 ATP synthase subunit A [Christensenellales bacterium]
MINAACLAAGKSVGEIMREALFPENVDFLGIGVSPSFYSALFVTGILLLFALIVRIFVIPRFKKVPGKFQLLLETLVGFFDKLAKGNSPFHNGFLGAYIFSAGLFVFFGTFIELFGFRAVMGDLNACVVMGFMSYGVILAGGLAHNGRRGFLGALKDFSLPISMSFRLFGAIIGGVLVTELIYVAFSIMSKTVVLPIFVAVMFTLMHAIVQTYILTLLTSMFFGEATHPLEKKTKKKKQRVKNGVKENNTAAESANGKI